MSAFEKNLSIDRDNEPNGQVIEVWIEDIEEEKSPGIGEDYTTTIGTIRPAVFSTPQKRIESELNDGNFRRFMSVKHSYEKYFNQKDKTRNKSIDFKSIGSPSRNIPDEIPDDDDPTSLYPTRQTPLLTYPAGDNLPAFRDTL